jgi:hypothetical protein
MSAICYSLHSDIPRVCKVENCDCESLDVYCLNHKCFVYGCKNPKLIDLTCGQHICKYLNCLSSRVNIYQVCSEHKCASRLRCSQLIGVGSRYCITHACPIPNCNKEAFSTTYCKLHNCSVFDCELPSEEGTIWCVQHTCLNCSNKVDIWYTRCIKHRCIIVNCENPRYDTSLACKEHYDIYT